MKNSVSELRHIILFSFSSQLRMGILWEFCDQILRDGYAKRASIVPLLLEIIRSYNQIHLKNISYQITTQIYLV